MSASTVPVDLLSGIKVVDVDTHLTEPHDLWTSRAPAVYRDRVPQVRDVDGVASWVFDDVVLGRAGAGGVVRRDGTKSLGAEFMHWNFDEVHLGAHTVGPRLEVMDRLGIWAQIVYPNVVGFGGQKFAEAKDLELRAVSVHLYNDAMAEIQESSGDRMFPMAILPWWDLEAAVAEVARVKDMGLKGVNTNADPQNEGLPDLGDPHWDPMWEACADLGLPLNFHIGASIQQSTYFGTTPWPSHGDDEKLALGSAMMYLGNARILSNLIYSGILERHPTLNVVSVESGIGWVPFVLEALDYQVQETAPSVMDRLSMKPSEYFRRQIYACFWFESHALVSMIENVGVDNCMFETDFPHPTCLYPDPLATVTESLAGVDRDFRYKVLSGNATRVYSLPVPALASEGMDPAYDPSDLAGWLGDRLSASDVRLDEFSRPEGSGFSAETAIFTARFRREGRDRCERFVVRRETPDPAVYPCQVPGLDVEIAIQYRVMEALAASRTVPVAPLVGYEPDPAVLGAAFFVMGFVEGQVPIENPLYTKAGFFVEAAPADRRRMISDGLRTLARIHSVDWQAAQLDCLSAPGSRPGAARQLEVWETYARAELGDREHPLLDRALAWLGAHVPDDGTVGLCWGDARPGNIIWRDFACVCVTDFEAACIAAPEHDLGWWLMFDRWVHETYGLPRLPGEPTRDEQRRIYEEMSGRPVGDTTFDEVFTAARYAAIVVRVMNRAVARGDMPPEQTIWLDNRASTCLAQLLDERT